MKKFIALHGYENFVLWDRPWCCTEGQHVVCQRHSGTELTGVIVLGVHRHGEGCTHGYTAKPGELDSWAVLGPGSPRVMYIHADEAQLTEDV